MAINFYQRVIYSNQLEHGVKGQRSSHHKYLYIDANGRYVYPEDLPKGTTGIQQHHAQVLSDRRQEKKQAKKDKAFVKRSKQMEDATNRLWDIHDGSTTATNFIKSHQQVQRAHQNATSGVPDDPTHSSYTYRDSQKTNQIMNRAKEIGKQYDQIASAHRGSTKLTSNDHRGIDKDLEWRIGDNESGRREVEERRARRSAYNESASRASKAQRQSAHQNAGGAYRSTSELERQKQKTANRKAARETMDRTDEMVERMRKRRKKQRPYSHY